MSEEEIEKRTNEIVNNFTRAWELSVVKLVTPAQRTAIAFLCLSSLYILLLRRWLFFIADYSSSFLFNISSKDDLLDTAINIYGYSESAQHLLYDVLSLVIVVWFMLEVFYPAFKDHEKRVLSETKNNASQIDEL